jgi:hypothetical protein
MAHYMQNHLSFEKIKDLVREYFFIFFSLQAPCISLTILKRKSMESFTHWQSNGKPSSGRLLQIQAAITETTKGT